MKQQNKISNRNMLSSIAQQTNSYGYVEARNLLTALSINSYPEIIHKINPSTVRRSKPNMEKLEFNLFPNPVSNPIEFNFNVGENKVTQFAIFDFTGRCIEEENNPILPFAIHNWIPPGSYSVLIKLDSGNSREFNLIVIQ